MTHASVFADKEIVTKDLRDVADLTEQWNQCDLLLIPGGSKRSYRVGFASSDRCVEEALRLRYEVFNVEMGHGLAASHATGLDRDIFDDQMTHLVLLDMSSRRIIGTYRLQTVTHALASKGVYAAQEYDLADMAPLFEKTLECGRACVARDHRKASTLYLLWAGIHAFARLFDQRYVFGCCSLSSQDPDDGWRALRRLRERGCIHPDLMLPALPEYSCGDPSREFDPDFEGDVDLPRLFGAYIKLGGMVISEPAIDREFHTIDFLVIVDGLAVNMAVLGIEQ